RPSGDDLKKHRVTRAGAKCRCARRSRRLLHVAPHARRRRVGEVTATSAMSVFPRLVGCALMIAGCLPLRREQADATPARDLSYFELKDVTLLDGPFRHAQQLGADYVLALEPDRLLAGFRLEAGLEPKVKKYPNWESSCLDGHTLGHYLTALA